MYAEAHLDHELLELWHRLANDPDSPDHFEITEHGEIVLSPKPTNRHQSIIRVLTRQIEKQLGGAALQEVTMLTLGAGIRCPDVVWLPENRMSESLVDGPMETVPPLVAEVLSPGNRKTEMAHKIRAYLDSGVEEVIEVALDGRITFHRDDGSHAESAMSLKLVLSADLFL